MQGSSSWARIRLMGMPIDVLGESEAIERIFGALEHGRGGWVITPNLDQLRLYFQRPELRPYYEAAELVVADGMPLVWASWLQRTPLPERIAGSNLIWSLSAQAAKRGASIFLLGGSPGSAESALRVLRLRYPTLTIAGHHVPPMGFEKQPEEVERIRASLREHPAAIVFVGLGFPKQEQLIWALRREFPQAWFLGIGISFSFVGGHLSRAPAWAQRMGLEWLHRLSQEPGRLFKRYILRDLPFAFRLLGYALCRRQVLGPCDA